MTRRPTQRVTVSTQSSFRTLRPRRAHTSEADARLTQTQAATITNAPPSYTTCSKSLRGQEGLEALKHIGCASLEASHGYHSVCPCGYFVRLPDSRPPQYRYQAGAEDQALTKQLLGWIFDGKLDQITPAHIFAVSPPICKELVERFMLRRVETGSFEQVAADTSDTVSVLELAAK